MKLLLLSMMLAFTGCTLQSNSSNSVNTSTGTVGTGKSVGLSWVAGTGSVSGYYVEQTTASSGVYSVVATVTNTSTTVTGLSSGTTYQFRVRAYNNGGTSPYTSVISVTP